MPYQESVLNAVVDVFERDSVRFVCILDQKGGVLSKYNRRDVTDMEIDSILIKAVAIKTQTLQLPNGGEQASSIHIQGKSTHCSLYTLPDKNFLVLLIDVNPLSSAMAYISDTRALVYAKISEIFIGK